MDLGKIRQLINFIKAAGRVVISTWPGLNKKEGYILLQNQLVFFEQDMPVISIKAPDKVKKEYDEAINKLPERYERHKEIITKGAKDPNWPDGCNANLVRNHIIYYKNKLEEINKQYGLLLPEHFYLPTPEQVDKDYQAPNN